ncbi:hypothetical protein HDV00_011308 [Rhizophlyctis rosea]|nr:hypothetical protein HDV00_011308 [Rhizophlyctis rosea]
MDPYKRKGGSSGSGSSGSSSSKKLKSTSGASVTATASHLQPDNPYPHLVQLVNTPSLFQSDYQDKTSILAWDFGTRGSIFNIGEKGKPYDYVELPKTQYHPSERCKEASVVLYDAANSAARPVAVGYEAIKLHSHEPDYRTRVVKSFKLHLYDEVEDAWNTVGKSASEVLQDYMEHYIPQIQELVELDETLAILTAPAKAEPSALYKLRQAANRAGLHEVAIIPAQEAALLCVLNDLELMKKNFFKNESTVAVVDAGGGTVDIGVYRLIQARPPWKVEEVEKSISLVGAGEKMDLSAKNWFRNLVGQAAWAEFERSSPREFFEYEDAWDKIKGTYKNGNASFTFYPSLKTATKKHSTYYGLKGAQTVDETRILMPAQQIQNIFDSVIDPILELLNENNAKHHLDYIIPVGGMGKMPYFIEKLHQRFPRVAGAASALHWKNYSPRDLYVVRGAYLSGHPQTQFAASRIVKKTIGVVFYMRTEKLSRAAMNEADRHNNEEEDIDRVQDWPDYNSTPGHHGVEVYLLTTTEEVTGLVPFSRLNPEMCDEAVRYDVEFNDDWRGEKNMKLALRFHLAELMVQLRSADGSKEVRMHPAAVL